MPILYYSDFEQIEGQIDCWDNPNLRCVDEIPPPFRQIFSKYPTFNVLQSQVFDEVFYSGEFCDCDVIATSF